MYSEYLKSGGRIAILPPLLAQKIAAGEVIERPQSVVRELLDNAIDSGAQQIDLILEEGGNTKIIVQDNGTGMDNESLSLSWLPHATSKIAVESDLYAISSLGFRGEALSSIAAVSQLKISSCTADSGGCLSVNGGQFISLEPFRGKVGTRVEVGNLFFNLPARKQFLKRASTEASLIKAMLNEKALAHPAISFRYSNEMGLQAFYPACAGESAYLDRFCQVYPEIAKPRDFFHELRASTATASFRILVGQPMVYQNDRRMIQVFVNRRRVNEFAFLQAIEFGFTGYLPGGRFPIAALFLDINPDQVDVNIHPAKREVKIRDLQPIHAAIVRTIQGFLRTSIHQRTITEFRETQLEIPLPPTNSKPVLEHLDPSPRPVSYSLETLTATRTEIAEPKVEVETSPGFRYLGQVFGIFLLVEVDNSLVMLDMHAAHERILYDQFRHDGRRQELLLPLRIVPESAKSNQVLDELQPELSALGIVIEPMSDETWQLTAIPACFGIKPALICEVLEQAALYRENIERSLFASIACHSAIKDGDFIGHDQARHLIETALALPEQRCPHGRPIFFSLSKTELFELVGRKV